MEPLCCLQGGILTEVQKHVWQNRTRNHSFSKMLKFKEKSLATTFIEVAGKQKKAASRMLSTRFRARDSLFVEILEKGLCTFHENCLTALTLIRLSHIYYSCILLHILTILTTKPSGSSKGKTENN